jgi:hypothetical protein
MWLPKLFNVLHTKPKPNIIDYPAGSSIQTTHFDADLYNSNYHWLKTTQFLKTNSYSIKN